MHEQDYKLASAFLDWHAELHSILFRLNIYLYLPMKQSLHQALCDSYRHPPQLLYFLAVALSLNSRVLFRSLLLQQALQLYRKHIFHHFLDVRKSKQNLQSMVGQTYYQNRLLH